RCANGTDCSAGLPGYTNGLSAYTPNGAERSIPRPMYVLEGRNAVLDELARTIIGQGSSAVHVHGASVHASADFVHHTDIGVQRNDGGVSPNPFSVCPTRAMG